MKYEKPRLVPLSGATSKLGYGVDCAPGGTADSKCSLGGFTSAGDCDDGTTAASKCSQGNQTTDPGSCGCQSGVVATQVCAPTGSSPNV